MNSGSVAILSVFLSAFLAVSIAEVKAGQFDKLFGDEPISSDLLSRASAKKVFEVQGQTGIIACVQAYSTSNDGKILLRNDYTKKRSGGLGIDVERTGKLTPFYLSEAASVTPYHVTYRLLAAEISDLEVSGITDIGNNRRRVEYVIYPKVNDIGKLFSVPDMIPVVALFERYDDGWKLTEFMRQGTKWHGEWNKERFQVFSKPLA